MNKLYAIGELIIDFQSVGTGSLKDTYQFNKKAGGAPANVCAQAVKFGQCAIYLSKVGNDGFGDFLIESLNNEGIDTSYISKSNKYDTSLAFVSFREDGEREFSFYRSNAADLFLDIEDFNDVNFEENDILEFGSVALKTKESQEVHKFLIEKAKKSNALIAFDPNLRFNLWENKQELKDIVNEYIKYADIVKIGSDELEFVKDTDENKAVKEMMAEGVSIILVTYGSKGARIYINDQTYYNPGYKVKAVDTTGAGDSFFGAFLALVLDSNCHNLNYQLMLDIACKAGAYTTTGFGAIAAMGTLKEVKEVIK